MSNKNSTANAYEEKWSINRTVGEYESTLPIALTGVLSVILVIVIIIRIVQCCKQRKTDRIESKAKAKARLEAEALEKGRRGGVERSASVGAAAVAVPTKQERKKKKPSSFCKNSKKQELAEDEAGALIVPTNENGSLLQSGIRAHPTRKAENKSWYDSKLIPFIDEGCQSLDNLYLPENAAHEFV